MTTEPVSLGLGKNILEEGEENGNFETRRLFDV